MTDKITMTITQTDEASGEAISRTTVEWMGMDRDDANRLNLGLTGGCLHVVDNLAADKASQRKQAQ